MVVLQIIDHQWDRVELNELLMDSLFKYKLGEAGSSYLIEMKLNKSFVDGCDEWGLERKALRTYGGGFIVRKP